MILIIGLLFFLKSYIFIDPDFGWHLKMGELILKHGIPLTDPFSYTMPSFPFVDHEWLTNVIFYILYQNIGTAGMALITAVIAVGLILIIKSQNRSKYFPAPLFLFMALLLFFWGIRPQIETILYTAILLKVVSSENIRLKWKWFLPLFFLAWANLHGGFAGGLIIFYLLLGLKSLSQRKIFVEDAFLAFVCTGVTLINPYGINLWREVWQQLSDGNLRWSIAEWAPLFLPPNWGSIIFIPLLALSGMLVIYFRKKLSLPKLGLYVFLLLAGLSNQRHIPLWVLSALPITTWGLDRLYTNIKSVKFAPLRFNRAYQVLLVFSFCLFIVVSLFGIKSTKTWQGGFYPEKAVDFIRQYSPGERIFSSYGWGGYLIWQLPGQKVFVDGRMPSWRWQPPSQAESAGAFDEYNKLLYNSEGLEILDKYKVQLVLWPAQHETKNPLGQKLWDWEKKLLGKNFSAPGAPTLEKRLAESHWKKIYQDSVSVVYQRP